MFARHSGWQPLNSIYDDLLQSISIWIKNHVVGNDGNWYKKYRSWRFRQANLKRQQEMEHAIENPAGGGRFSTKSGSKEAAVCKPLI